jgi:ABC-2 type transport system ATP-binding protein
MNKPDSGAALAIEARALCKRYGDVVAATEIDLSIPKGHFFGLLGPNGAGKTSIIHMLSTLIPSSAGEARVAGFDVRSKKIAVRARIGVVFQDAALDRTLSVTENLRFAGALHSLPRPEVARRTDELLSLFGLDAQRNRVVASLSGGMRRALDIARGIIHRPQVLFLDEPTIGLDLPNRRAIWRHISQLRSRTGMTVFLTTHYLEQAAECDDVAFLRAGQIVRRGNPRALIDELGAYIVEIETDAPAALAERLAPRFGEPLIEPDRLHFRCDEAYRDVAAADLYALLHAEAGESPRAIRWRKPNLNDVFLWVSMPAPARRIAA